MNTGIQILIERMKTNPEEFQGDGKWDRVMRDYWEHILPEDQDAYTLAYGAMMQDQFTEVVMKKLAGAGDDDGVSLTSVSHNDVNPLTSRIRMQGRHVTGLADPVQMYDQRDALRNAYQNDQRDALRNTYQNNPYQGMGQQPLRVSTQTDDSNSLYSVPSLQKASAEGNILSQIAKRMGRK